jgi:predicted Ser/Thr protein kinase
MPGRLAYAMRALGKKDLPRQIRVHTAIFTLEQTVKHDFFAATGFYRDELGQKAVAKFGRTAPFFGFPLGWIGRWLVRRELRFYRRLAGVANVPAMIGKLEKIGFVHEYVAGRHLKRDEPVPETFFADLAALLHELHHRQIAYVDMNKPENILLGDDGKPHLIDFQISWDLKGLGNNFINRWFLQRLQKADIYHLLKHKKRMRPEQMTEQERKIVENRGFWIHAHRIVTRPYFFVRRRMFRWLRGKGWVMEEGSK